MSVRACSTRSLNLAPSHGKAEPVKAVQTAAAAEAYFQREEVARIVSVFPFACPAQQSMVLTMVGGGLSCLGRCAAGGKVLHIVSHLEDG